MKGLMESLDNIEKAVEMIMKNGEDLAPASVCMLVDMIAERIGQKPAELADFVASSVKEVNEALDF